VSSTNNHKTFLSGRDSIDQPCRLKGCVYTLAHKHKVLTVSVSSSSNSNPMQSPLPLQSTSQSRQKRQRLSAMPLKDGINENLASNRFSCYMTFRSGVSRAQQQLLRNVRTRSSCIRIFTTRRACASRMTMTGGSGRSQYGVHTHTED
jgi:hypothetical protein